jgi:hypothetical protein
MSLLKNASASTAAADLGLSTGDALQIELQNKLDEAKKTAGKLDGPKGLLGYALSPAAQSLGLGGIGMNGVG